MPLIFDLNLLKIIKFLKIKSKFKYFIPIFYSDDTLNYIRDQFFF